MNKLGRYAEPSAEQIAAEQPSLSVNCVTPLEVSFLEMLDVSYGSDFQNRVGNRDPIARLAMTS